MIDEFYFFPKQKLYTAPLRDCQEINFTVCQGKSCSDLDDFSAADGLVSLCKEKSSRDE
jgi:hypothetical protein